MDRTVVLMHMVRLDIWRFRFEFSVQTRASVERIRQMNEFGALRARAVSAWGEADHVAWAVEEHWDEGGDWQGAMALMQRIADGVEPDPWADGVDT
jgi:hypothetical protein